MTSSLSRKRSGVTDDLTAADQLIIKAFAKLDKLALGIAIGTVTGLIIFAATAFLIIKGGNTVGQNLSLLNQYFIGYSVTWVGSIIGLLYGFLSGFILGWTAAFLRNLSLTIYIRLAKLNANFSSVQDFMDNP
jgi:hypothetical protein